MVCAGLANGLKLWLSTALELFVEVEASLDSENWRGREEACSAIFFFVIGIINVSVVCRRKIGENSSDLKT